MKHAILVGVGGFFGSILRWLVARWVHAHYPMLGVPLGTLAVNLTGCLAIGLLAGSVGSPGSGTDNLRLLFGVGLLGGYTTYSTFALDSLTLLNDGSVVRATGFVVAHIGLGIAAAAFGVFVARGVLGLGGTV